MLNDPIISLLPAPTARAPLAPTTDLSEFRPSAASPSPEPRQHIRVANSSPANSSAD